jgi:hypothetical protein
MKHNLERLGDESIGTARERPDGAGQNEGGAMLRKGQFSHRQAGDEGNWTDDANQWFGQPDVLCLHEYLHIYQGRSTETPERRLVAAVLRDAVECYLRTCRAPNRRKKRSFREVEEWFFRNDDSGVFSLENVCAILNLSAGYIRRMLLEYQAQNIGAVSSRKESADMLSSKELLLAS